ncbi:MAG: acyl-CoA dehydrogenase family protein [Pseudomonadota bacterium]
MTANVAHIAQPQAETTADQLIERIEAALPELQALSLGEEQAGRLSERTIACLAEIGVFDMAIPPEYGGTAMSALDQFRVYTAVGKIAGSTGWVSWVTTTHVRWIAMFSEQAREEVWGIDWPAPRVSGVITATGPGKARPVDGGYMLQGTWPFCSGCPHTAWSILGAVSVGPDGAVQPILALVPAADLTIANDWAVSGMKATGSNSVKLPEEVFVPRHRTIGLMDAILGNWANPPLEQPLYKNNFALYTTALSGATPLGMAKGALDYYMARLETRGITATDYKVQADAAITHLQLAEAVSRIDASEARLSANAAELDRRAVAGEACDDLFRAKVRFDVALSVRECAEAIEILHRGSGAATIHEKNPMQRYARDVRVATVHAQFNFETCAEDYGRALCGKPLFGNFLPPVK